MQLKEKMIYLEKKFNAPMYIVMKTINFCAKNNICVTKINLKEILSSEFIKNY